MSIVSAGMTARLFRGEETERAYQSAIGLALFCRLAGSESVSA